MAVTHKGHYVLIDHVTEAQPGVVSVLRTSSNRRFTIHDDMTKWWISYNDRKWEVFAPSTQYAPGYQSVPVPAFDSWEEAALYAWDCDNRCGDAPSLIEFLAFNLSPAAAHHG